MTTTLLVLLATAMVMLFADWSETRTYKRLAKILNQKIPVKKKLLNLLISFIV